jgi:hypothetical protein
MRDVWGWDEGKHLGKIPEANKTFNVMGNANSEGVVIGETTQGGLQELSHTGWDERNGTIIDYGSLIWITLQRSASARAAIKTMAWLANTYGCACGDHTARSLLLRCARPTAHLDAHAQMPRRWRAFRSPTPTKRGISR